MNSAQLDRARNAGVTVLGCIGVLILFTDSLRRPVLSASLAVTRPVFRAIGDLAGTEPAARLAVAADEIKSVPQEAGEVASAALKKLPEALIKGSQLIERSALDLTHDLSNAAQSGELGKRYAPPGQDGSSIIPQQGSTSRETGWYDPSSAEEKLKRKKITERLRRGGGEPLIK